MRRGPDSILRGGGQSTVSCSNKRLLLLAPLCEQLLLQHLPFYVDEPSLILHKHFTDFKGCHCNCKSTYLWNKLTNFFPIMGNNAIDRLPGKTSEKGVQFSMVLFALDAVGWKVKPSRVSKRRSSTAKKKSKIWDVFYCLYGLSHLHFDGIHFS